MARPSGSALLLIIFGLTSGLISLGATTQLGNSPPEQLAIGLALIFSGGFIVLGIAQMYEHKSVSELTLPGKILLLVGFCTIIGSIFVFRPWRVDRTQGFRTIITGIWVFVGSGLALAGRQWRHPQKSRYSLAVLTTGLLLSLFYVLYESLDAVLPPFPTPGLLLFVVIAGIPGMWVLYRYQPKIDTR